MSSVAEPDKDGIEVQQLDVANTKRQTAKGEIAKTDAVQTEELPVRTKTKKVILLIALYFSLFPAALDQVIVSTAIPTISNYFQTASGYSWIGSAYLIATATSSPVWGRFSDIWGRKAALLTALGMFFVSSIMCAASVSMRMLIGSRAVQGIAAGGILVMVNICISDLISLRHRGFFTAVSGVVWAIADALGPLLGGIFSQHLSWRWCWWINLPICGAGFMGIYFFLDLHNPHTNLRAGIKAIDWLGTITIVGSSVMFLLGLDFGSSTFPWSSAKVICLIVFGIAMIGLFLISEIKVARYPLVPVHLLRNRSSVATLIVSFAHGFVHIAGEYFLPLFLQSVLGASPSRSGVLLLPLAVCESVGAIIGGITTSKTGRYVEFARASMFLTTLSFGLFIKFGPSTSIAQIVGLEVLAGLSVGIGFSPPFTAIQTTVSRQDRAAALSTLSFTRTLAQAVSVVIGDVVFQARMDSKQARLDAVLPQGTAVLFAGKSAAANLKLIETLPQPAMSVVRSAYSASISNMWIVYVCVAFVGGISTLFMKHVKLERTHVETKTGLDHLQGREEQRPMLLVEEPRAEAGIELGVRTNIEP